MIKMALAATLSLILVKASVGASLHIEDFRFVETSRGDIVEPSAKITFLSEDIFKGTRNTKGYQSFFQIKNIGTFFGFGFKGDWAEFNFLARGHLMDKLPSHRLPVNKQSACFRLVVEHCHLAGKFDFRSRRISRVFDCAVSNSLPAPHFDNPSALSRQIRSNLCLTYSTRFGYSLLSFVGSTLRLICGLFCPVSSAGSEEQSPPTNKQAEEARNHLPPRPSSGFVGSVSSLPLGAKIGISIIFALLATSVLGLAGWLSYVNLRRGIALASISGCLFALSGVFAWLASPY